MRRLNTLFLIGDLSNSNHLFQELDQIGTTTNFFSLKKTKNPENSSFYSSSFEILYDSAYPKLLKKNEKIYKKMMDQIENLSKNFDFISFLNIADVLFYAKRLKEKMPLVGFFNKKEFDNLISNEDKINNFIFKTLDLVIVDSEPIYLPNHKFSNNSTSEYLEKIFFTKFEDKKGLYFPIYEILFKNNFIDHVSIKLLSKCNAQCVMCDIGNKIGGEYFLEKYIILKILDELKEIGVEFITFTGGEPTLRNDLIELVEYAKKLGFKVFLSTNAHLLSKEKISRLKKAGLFGFKFSLDSIDKEKHDNIRRLKDNFDQVIFAIKESVKEGMEVYVNSVIMNHTYKESLDFLRYLSSLNVKNISFSMLEEENESLKYVLSKEQVKEFYIEIMPNLYYLAKEQGIFLKINPQLEQIANSKKENMEQDITKNLDKFNDEIINFSELKYGKTFFKKNPCKTITSSFMIRENGNIYPCCMASGNKMSMGDIKTQSIRNILESKKYHLFKEDIAKSKNSICEYCKDGIL